MSLLNSSDFHSYYDENVKQEIETLIEKSRLITIEKIESYINKPKFLEKDRFKIWDLNNDVLRFDDILKVPNDLRIRFREYLLIHYKIDPRFEQIC